MQILHRPLSHHHYPARASMAAAGMVADFKTLFPHATPGILSFPNWTENTAMMLALRDEANHKAIPFHVLNAVEADVDDIAGGVGALTPARQSFAPDTVMWGFFHQNDSDALPVPANLLWNSREMVGLINRWAESGIFESMAGQTFQVVAPSLHPIRHAMHRFHAAGHRYATLKCAGMGWVHFLDLSQDLPQELEVQLIDAAEAAEPLVLQTMIDSSYEYRMFIVGGEVVTGSGCLDDFTPLNHIAAHPFDLRMEKRRGEGFAPVAMPELTAGYLEFAKEFATQWAMQVSGETSYALDMCWDNTTKQIVPMELSPLANSGLYASSTKLLAKAFCAGFA